VYAVKTENTCVTGSWCAIAHARRFSIWKWASLSDLPQERYCTTRHLTECYDGQWARSGTVFILSIYILTHFFTHHHIPYLFNEKLTHTARDDASTRYINTC